MDSTLLGVLIGGGTTTISAWIVAWQHHRTEVKKAELELQNTKLRLELEHNNTLTKLEFERRTKMLMECAENCYNHLSILTDYFVDIKLVNQSRNTPAWPDIGKVLIPHYDKIKRAFFDLIACQSKLILLNEKNCAEKLSNYVKATKGLQMDMDKLRDESVYQAATKQLSELLDARAAFLEEIQKAFNSTRNQNAKSL